jgi:hypothetical protein
MTSTLQTDEQKVDHQGQTPGDEALLASFESKLRVLKDRIVGTAEGFYPGAIVVSEGGVGKTHTIVGTLTSMNRPFVLLNSHVTGSGLFRVLKQAKDSLILCEDSETLFDDRKSLGLLRSALDCGLPGEGGKLVRAVTWGTNKPESVYFSGALIVVANRQLPNSAEMRAIETRVPVIRLEFSKEETAAKIRAIASKGYTFGEHHVSPAQCLEVAKLVIKRSEELDQAPNIRVVVQAWRDWLQWSMGAAECDWKELVESRIRKQATSTPRNPKAMQREVEFRLLAEMEGLPTQQQLQRWEEVTKKKRDSYFRRQKEYRQSEQSDVSQATSSLNPS